MSMLRPDPYPVVTSVSFTRIKRKHLYKKVL